MKKHVTAVCSALVLAGVAVTAQAPQHGAQARPADTVTVTGCVTRGETSTSGDTYTLTSVQQATMGTRATGQSKGDHHTSYALTTDGTTTVDLAKHLNHKVELTGTLDDTTRQSPQTASTGTSGSTGTATVGRDANAMGMPAVTLKVTALKMLSATCR